MKTPDLYGRLCQAAFLLLLFGAKSAVYSQTSSDSTDGIYQYQNFRFPDIDRRALDLSASASGGVDRSASHSGTINSKSTQSSASQFLSLNYSRFKNSEKTQLQEMLSLQENTSFNKRKSTVGADTKRALTRISVDFSLQRRDYIRPNFFLGYEIDVNGQYYHETERRTDINPPSLAEIRSAIQRTEAYFLIGRGRIEPIDDVFLAKFMMDDLLENGVLDAPFEEEQLFSLGRVMAAIRNRRIFDLRRRRIYELTRLDDWFKEQNLVRKDDILYFTTLMDNWLYSPLNTRSTGERLTFKIGPKFDYSEFLLSAFSTFSTHTYAGGNLEVNYDRHRPLSALLQEEISVFSGLEYFHRIRPEEEGNRQLIKPFAGVSVRYGVFPDSRTAASLNMGIRYEYYLGSFPEAKYRYGALLPFAGASINYFVNYRLRLYANLNLSATYTSASGQSGAIFPDFPDAELSNQADWQLDTNFSLQYSLF